MAYVAGFAIVTSLLSSKEDDSVWKANAAKAGRNTASVEFSRSRALQSFEAKEREIKESAVLATVQATQDEAATVATATVQAAAAGASGENVNQTIQGVFANGTAARGQIEKARKGSLLQLDQNREDVLWQAENKTFDAEVDGGASSGQRVAAAAIAGASAYMNSRG